ncbi:hypothetical protein EPN87_02215 [archaeon]|nr:MAG: hypothetical protein EPN87_02215 [archaeon]
MSYARQKEKILITAFKAYVLAANEVSKRYELSVTFPHPKNDFCTDITLYRGSVRYSFKPNGYNPKSRQVDEPAECFIKELRSPKITRLESALGTIENSPIGNMITVDMVNKYLEKV